MLGPLDPLLQVPFATGVLVVAVLCEVGVLLRLREEWMAALGFAHLGAAGALLAAGSVVPVLGGAAAGALAGVILKQAGGARGNAAYALMYLAGWSALMLIAANSALGHSVGRALLDGQLYFAAGEHLAAALLAAVTLASGSRWLSRRLVRARLQPDYERANALPAWRWHLAFDAGAALAIALAIATVGVVAAFALAFVPAWIAYRAAPSWRACRALGLAIGIAAYLLAFALALVLDQPFGPVLVAVLLVAALASLALRPRAATRNDGGA